VPNKNIIKISKIIFSIVLNTFNPFIKPPQINNKSSPRNLFFGKL